MDTQAWNQDMDIFRTMDTQPRNKFKDTFKTLDIQDWIKDMYLEPCYIG